MSESTIKGKIHSIQSLGALDGPGIRFTVFMQGCNLRCGCCHNPDTWEIGEGTEYTAEQIVAKAVRYREYFGTDGGITLTGGEPLLQAVFAKEVFRLCHAEGINTCLDTSGSIINGDVKELLAHTDRVLLDIKYTDDELYRKHVGCNMNKPLAFLQYLNRKNIHVTLRQVIIPTLNDNQENIFKLKSIARAHSCVDKTELLPFRKMCQMKYDKLEKVFPFANIPEPSEQAMRALEKILYD